jgi:hypothetical protein
MIPILGVVAVTPANAAPAPKPPKSPTHCTATHFHQGASEGISVSCRDSRGGFRVVAVCASFRSRPWTVYGTVGRNGRDRSTAVCHGMFPFGARVVDYHVENVSY